MNKMKNFKRRFSLSVPRTETIEEAEFTEQFNQLHNRRNEGEEPHSLTLPALPPAFPASLADHPALCSLREKGRLGGPWAAFPTSWSEWQGGELMPVPLRPAAQFSWQI
jgi:hypothetical protein